MATITITIDDPEVTPEFIQHLMGFGAAKAQIRVEGYSIDGYVSSISAGK
jgi:hypothetical protein